MSELGLLLLLAGFARENEGLWVHRIFELIGRLEQRIPKRKSKT